MNQEIVTRKINDIDIPRLEEFYRRVWPDIYMHKFPERNNWIIKLNPFIPKDFGYPVWISEINGKIVGHTSALIIPYLIENEIVLASTSVDTIVDTEYRGLRIGQVLQLNNRNSNKLFVSIGIAPINKYIKAKQGNINGPNTYDLFYFYKLDIEAYLLHLLNKIRTKSKIAEKIIEKSGIIYLFLYLLENKLKSKIRNKHTVNDLTFIETTEFDNRFDEVWNKCRFNYDLCAERTKEYLEWKYSLVPKLKYKKFIIADKRGQNVGVLIFRMGDKSENHIVLISELYFTENNPDWYEQTFCFLRNSFNKSEVTALNMFTADFDVFNFAIKFGFRHIKNVTPMYYYTKKTEKNFCEMKALISRGESDLDQIGLLQQPFLKDIIKQIFKF